jgi:putative salt-induced outer membrane protein YdiY
MKALRVLGFLLSLFLTLDLFSQTDSLILINGDVIIGEVKSMNKSVMQIETAYSDADFKIEWEGVKEIYTEGVFLIILENGDRITAKIETSTPTHVNLIGTDRIQEVNMDSIIYMDQFGNTFLSNFYASLGLGLNLTKANNLTQFSLNGSAGYLARKWSLDLYFNSLNSAQDEIDNTKRTEVGLEYRYILVNKWYLSAAVDFLSNTEQALKLRSNGRLGGGYFPAKNNKLYWGMGAGLNANIETFSNEAPDRQSLEAYFGTEINLFNVEDFSLLSNIYVYPSLTEAARIRVNYLLNLNYDLPFDFYIGMNFSLNYDNQPAEEGKETDYVFGVNFGWSL